MVLLNRMNPIEILIAKEFCCLLNRSLRVLEFINESKSLFACCSYGWLNWGKFFHSCGLHHSCCGRDPQLLSPHLQVHHQHTFATLPKTKKNTLRRFIFLKNQYLNNLTLKKNTIIYKEKTRSYLIYLIVNYVITSVFGIC